MTIAVPWKAVSRGAMSPTSPTSGPRVRLLLRCDSASNLEALGCWYNGVSGSAGSRGVLGQVQGRTHISSTDSWSPPAVKAISAPPSRAKPAVKNRSPAPDAAAAAPPSPRAPPPPPPEARTAETSAPTTKELPGSQRSQEAVGVEAPPPKESNAFWDYQFLFKSQRLEVETPIRLEVVHGKVPQDVGGEYYLCGPGIFTDDHGSNIHPLDGHGYLRKFSVRDGAVHYSAKYIDTEARQEEYDESSEEWKFVYRGPFSVLKGGLRFGNAKVMKNTANTSVLKWGHRLMCFWEGGEPYEVHPRSLDTLGLCRLTAGDKTSKSEENPFARLKGVAAQVQKLWNSSMNAHEIACALHIQGVSLTAKLMQPILNGMYAMPEERTLAHVKVDNRTERLIIITCRAEDMVLPISTFTVYEFDTRLELQERKQFVLPQQLMIHDWGLTDNYYVLVANRVRLSPVGSIGALLGVSPMISAISTDASLPYTPLYLLPRTSAAEQGRNWKVPFRIPQQFWLLHTANSYEETDEKGRVRIVLDGSFCSYKWMSLNNMFGYRWQNRRLDHGFMNNTNPADNEAAHLTRIFVTVDSGVAPTSADQQHHMIPNHLHASADSQPPPPADHNHSLQIAAPQSPSRTGTPTRAGAGAGAATPPSKAVQMQYFRTEPLPSCDFPTINPHVAGRKYKYVYVAGSSGIRSELRNFPFDSIVKLQGPTGKRTSWWAGDRTFVGEPVFVPREGAHTDPTSPAFEEDDGYILVVQYAAAQKTCYLVILDAQKIGKRDPVVARMRVPKEYAFPLGFHGFWDESPEITPSRF